jgi:hypothetical protein
MTTATDLRFAARKGYVQPPGTGPFGETCGSCRHRRPTSCDNRTWVCGLESRHIDVPIASATKSCARWETSSR